MFGGFLSGLIFIAFLFTMFIEVRFSYESKKSGGNKREEKVKVDLKSKCPGVGSLGVMTTGH